MSNVEYLWFFAGKCSGQNQNKYSKFKIRHGQIDDMSRSLDKRYEFEIQPEFYCVHMSQMCRRLKINSLLPIYLSL